VAEFPDASKCFSALDTQLSPEQVAGLYGVLGWRVARSAGYGLRDATIADSDG
jgi:hypothetical protein